MHDFISQMSAFIGFYEGKMCSSFFWHTLQHDVSVYHTNTKRKTYEPRSFVTQLVLVLCQVMCRGSVFSPEHNFIGYIFSSYMCSFLRINICTNSKHRTRFKVTFYLSNITRSCHLRSVILLATNLRIKKLQIVTPWRM